MDDQMSKQDMVDCAKKAKFKTDLEFYIETLNHYIREGRQQ